MNKYQENDDIFNPPLAKRLHSMTSRPYVPPMMRAEVAAPVRVALRNEGSVFDRIRRWNIKDEVVATEVGFYSVYDKSSDNTSKQIWEDRTQLRQLTVQCEFDRFLTVVEPITPPPPFAIPSTKEEGKSKVNSHLRYLNQWLAPRIHTGNMDPKMQAFIGLW